MVPNILKPLLHGASLKNCAPICLTGYFNVFHMCISIISNCNSLNLFLWNNDFHRLKTPVQNSLRDAKLSFSDLDEVILVGGSTRIPAVQELVKKITGKDPNVTVNPDEVVALGAAVQVVPDTFSISSVFLRKVI